MKVLLLAAGEGTRLRPLTYSLPKCLMPIKGTPLLGMWIKFFKDHQIEDIFINTNYLSNQVTDYIESCHMDSIHIVHEAKLRGTGGTIKSIAKFLGESDLILVHADNLSLFNLEKFIECFRNRPKNCLMTLMSFRTDQPETCGILELDDRKIVYKFHEKVANPPGNLANAAIYILTNQLVKDIARTPQDFIDFSLDIIPNLLGKINCFENNNYHRDIGNISSLRKAQTDFDTANNCNRYYYSHDFKNLLSNKDFQDFEFRFK